MHKNCVSTGPVYQPLIVNCVRGLTPRNSLQLHSMACRRVCGSMWGWSGVGARLNGAACAVDSLAPSVRAAAGRTAFCAPSRAFFPQPTTAGQLAAGLAAVNKPWARWGSADAGGHMRAMSSVAAATGRVYTPPTAFAVAEIGGKQYKVTVDDSIVTENMVGHRVGDTVVFDKVMMIGDKSKTTVGQPYITGASVTAVIEQLTLAPKVYIFKKRRRKNSRRLRGFRAAVTSLRIRSITIP